jgi:lipopolysaccharide export LptBFGC system permease protein LptF
MFNDARYSIIQSTAYSLLQIPGEVVEFGPIAILCGVLIAFSALSNKGELIALESLGIKRARLALPAVHIVLIISVILLCATEFVVPLCSQKAIAIKTKMNYGIYMAFYKW